MSVDQRPTGPTRCAARSLRVAPSTAALEHGTFTIVPSPPGEPVVGPEPLTLELDEGGLQQADTQLLYFPHPRVLQFGVGFNRQDAGMMSMNNYSICLPMP